MTLREYPLKTAKRLEYFAYAIIFFALGATLSLKEEIDPVVRGFFLLSGFICLIASVILVSLAMRCRLILDENRIEFRSALRTFTADRNEIEGLRTIENQNGRWIRICLKEGRGAFTVSETFTGNDDLNEWIKGLPDLDERDADRIALQIKHSGSLGATEDQRLHALDRAKAWAIGLSIAAGIASIPVLFVNSPLSAASLGLLVLFTPLGILLLHHFPLLFTLFKVETDPRAYIGFVIVWPGIAMLFSYKTGGDPTHLVNASQLILWALLALLCYVAALFRVAWGSDSRWVLLAALLIFGGLYSFGLVNAINTLADRSVPRPYSSVVLKKHGPTARVRVTTSALLNGGRWPMTPM
jgi:hypothetical protein